MGTSSPLSTPSATSAAPMASRAYTCTTHPCHTRPKYDIETKQSLELLAARAGPPAGHISCNGRRHSLHHSGLWAVLGLGIILGPGTGPGLIFSRDNAQNETGPESGALWSMTPAACAHIHPFAFTFRMLCVL